MSKVSKKTAQPTGPVVYCGPTIPGVAVQYTVYTNGAPNTLTEAIREKPVLGDLMLPLDELPEFRRQIRTGVGRYCTLYNAVRAIS